jgi:hypothetical protein
METKNFAKGLYYNPPHPKAPNFVIGRLSIKREDFRQWLNEQKFDEKGFLNLQILMSKGGKPYVAVDDYKAKQQAQPTNDPF